MTKPPKSKGRMTNSAKVAPYRDLSGPKDIAEKNLIQDEARTVPASGSLEFQDLDPRHEEDLALLLRPPPSLRKEERQQFNKVFLEICSTMTPEGFLERYQCREIASLIWRLEQLRDMREVYINDRMDLALAFIVIDRTSDDVVSLLTRIREGDVSSKKKFEGFKAKFDISDSDIRAHVELRYHDDLGRIDQHIRSIELTRDRMIDVFEKRRFMRLANKRLTTQLPKLVERL